MGQQARVITVLGITENSLSLSTPQTYASPWVGVGATNLMGQSPKLSLDLIFNKKEWGYCIEDTIIFPFLS